MADTVRHARADEMAELAALANRVFRSNRPGDMGGEFPTLFDPANAPLMCVVERAGRLVCLVGVHRFVMCVRGVGVPVASIGSVCTDPDHRGQGLAWQALHLAIGDARERGDVLMPISGGRSLYTRNFALPFGPSHHFTVPRDGLGPPMGRPAEPADADAIVALHEQAAVRYRWDRGLFEGLMRGRPRFGGSSWVQADPSGRVEAWALVFAGGTLHAPTAGEAVLADFAGPPQLVAALAASAMDRAGDSRLRFHVGWHRAPMIEFFRPRADKVDVAFARGATLKLLNLPELMSLVGCNERFESIRATESSLRLTVAGRTVELCDPAAVHHLLFTQPAHWPADLAGLTPDLAGPLAGPLPLPIPDYGLCYI